MKMQYNPIVKLFCELVSIPSPSGHERNVGIAIQKRLKAMGIASHFDDSGKKNGSNSGNLIAKVKGTKDTTVMLVCHMDTVEDGSRRIITRVKKGVISSDGDTILGADNKASVACAIIALGEAMSLPVRPNVTCVFSTREESGIMGARCIDSRDKVDYAFIFDGEGPLGAFMESALGYLPFEIHLKGKAVHAAYNPGQGANAVKAAGIMISRLKLGKDANGGTLNVGLISGGTKVNVVPEDVSMSGEIRAFTNSEIERKVREVERLAKESCKLTGCKYELVLKRDNFSPPFSAKKGAPIISVARKAAMAAKLPFELRSLRATSEVNSLSLKYGSVLGVYRGGSAPHSKSERIGIKELSDLKSLMLELIKNC